MDDNGRWSSSLSDVAGNTLPEHYSALALLQQLDHAWFLDNLIKPRVGLINAFGPSSPSLSPYQSIELVDATRGKWGSSACHDPRDRRDMPCTRFEVLPHSETPARARDLAEGSNNLQPIDHLLQESVSSGGTDRPLTPRRHVSASPLADIVLCPPTRVQTWSVEDFQHVKESEVNQVAPTPDLESGESEQQLRVSLVDTKLPQPALGVRKFHRKCSRSMTALEFDELQGFVDLGFQFSHDDLTPRIVTMFPALKHKLGRNGELGERRVIHGKLKHNSLDAWLVRGFTGPAHHWQIPATSEDMKEHLKFWARAVASTVRQEC